MDQVDQDREEIVAVVGALVEVHPHARITLQERAIAPEEVRVIEARIHHPGVRGHMVIGG
jgi:hypothetical protein